MVAAESGRYSMSEPLTDPLRRPPMSATSPAAVDAYGFTHVFLPDDPSSVFSPLTVLALHGTGGDERDLLPLVARVAPGAAIISPRGRVLEQGRPRFFRRLAEGVFDLADLAVRTRDLAAFVDTAAAAYGRDRARVVAVGFSNGANIAASLLLQRPGAFAGAALLRPMVPYEPETAPVPPAGAAARVLITAGRADPIVPREQPERLASLLRAAGCTVDVRWTAAGHQLARDDLTWTTQLVADVAGVDGTHAEGHT